MYRGFSHLATMYPPPVDEGAGLLFPPPPRFPGLPAEGFAAFAIPDRQRRRREIVAAFHPVLEALATDLLPELTAGGGPPLHAHLPRLDWPPGYQPFCTWLALSHEAHGYQAAAQLNLGIHADHVAVRLGWDTTAAAFGRFEFLCRHAGLGDELAARAAEEHLLFRVYAAAPWPEGSRQVFASAEDWAASFEEVRRRGVWWELGQRLDLPAALPVVTSPALGDVARQVFRALAPVLAR